MSLLNADGTPLKAVDNAAQLDFADSEHSFKWDHELGRPIAVKSTQDVDDAALSALSDLRVHSANRREGDMMKIASIPVVVVDKWAREGFDVFKHSAKEIVAKLKAEDMGYFMATGKNI